MFCFQLWCCNCLSPCFRIIQELMRKLRVHIGCLYKLCENIAELDLLVAFALVSSSENFVPPTFGNKMALKDSRHPILDVINSSVPVANDVVQYYYCSYNF